jgi:hypothetical protein
MVRSRKGGRIGSNLLIDIDIEFAFFVDQRGRFIRSSSRIDWEGAPDSFALSYPYILAFEPDFIEVRNAHTVSFFYLLSVSSVHTLIDIIGRVGTSDSRKEYSLYKY